jgi:uncharacterized membrane protein YsdA (DUF1294 family)
MGWLNDPRNRPALIGAFGGGAAVFAIFWLVLGLSPLLAWVVAWSLPAFAMYGIDKRQAANDGWRVPEAVLHALALVGGVVGAWAGRAVFRHKTQKPVFLVVLVVASIVWIAVAVLSFVD